MTTIYLTRHTKPDKTKYQNVKNELKKNKSIELSIEGISKAKTFFQNKEFDDLNNVYCSDYIRSIETGKIVKKNIIIDKRFGERITGIIDTSLTPNEYFYKQVLDENYKFEKGETKKEIETRMYNALIDVINENKNKKALIITHGTSLTFLLMKLCDLKITNIENKIRRIKYNDKIIFEDKFSFLETFKLTFDEENKLINIENIRGNNENI